MWNCFPPKKKKEGKREESWGITMVPIKHFDAQVGEVFTKFVINVNYCMSALVWLRNELFIQCP